MSASEHLAVNAVCEALHGLTKKSEHEAVTIACLAIGKDFEPTGLESTATRPMKYLHWDHTVTDLRLRMIELIEQFHFDERAVVISVVGTLDLYFARSADSEFNEQAKSNRIQLLARLHRELALPVDQRDQNADDEAVENFIRFVEESIDGMESQRLQAVADLEYLRGKFSRFYTWKFWHSIE